MKGIPIKFRGKRVDNGEYIYCDLLTGDNAFAIINDTWRAMVVPDSVAQLVGYDADGKEIYEDDRLESSTIDYAVLIPAHKVLNRFTGKYDLKGLSPDDVAAWNIKLKG